MATYQIFRRGDKVKVNGISGTIKDTKLDKLGATGLYDYFYQIKFDDNDIIGDLDFYPSGSIKLDEKECFIDPFNSMIDELYGCTDTLEHKYSYKDNKIYCPICGNKWHVDGYHGKWKDCLVCNKKREDIVKGEKK